MDPIFRRRKRIDFHHHDIPTKANRVLNFILIGLILIFIRVWHLSVIEYDEKLEESKKPQRKIVIEPATRSTIRDRFNLPLAINKISYQATILYSQLKDIPSFTWQKDSTGKKVKIFKRKEYIRKLSQILGKELNICPERIEDLIHAKASYYSRVPYVIKDDLSEQEYYRLKLLQKDWPGLYVRHLPKRSYPQGRVAADVIGYLGAINKKEYEKILHEIKALEHFIQSFEKDEEVEILPGIDNLEMAHKRLHDLEAKAYSIHDYVGKTGIEGNCEELLRGFYGKKNFYTDSKGNFLRELPGTQPALSGHRILLTLSSELQEYAEQLLAENEELRLVRKSALGPVKQTVVAQKEPWIKGGGVVVMDPTSGEILTLASYPRFDPNDFIKGGDSEEQKQKRGRIHQWLENDFYLAQLWNQQQPLRRERYDTQKKRFYDEEIWMSWTAYLQFILPESGKQKQAIERIKTLSQAIELQRQVAHLSSFFPDENLYTIFNLLYYGDSHEHHGKLLKGIEREKLSASLQMHQEEVNKIKKQVDPFFKDLPQNYDKVLLVDLCRLAVAEDRFSPELIPWMGKETLFNHHEHAANLAALFPVVKEIAKKLYHENDFKMWRQKEEKNFLKDKRAEEKNAKTYPKPYLDYLDRQEQLFFQEFWKSARWDFLMTFLTGERKQHTDGLDGGLEVALYLNEIHDIHKQVERSLEDSLTYKSAYESLKKSVKALPYEMAVAYLQTLRPYEELNRPLLGQYRFRRGKPALEKHLASAFYPVYGNGYGRSHAYRQATIQGSLFKLVTAYEALVQRFQKLGKKVISPQDLNPLIIIDEVYQKGSTRYVGYTEDGKPIPQLYKGGRLPRSLAHKNNGKVDLLRALEVSSNPYFSLLAGECLECPEDLAKAAKLFSFGSRTGIDLPGEIPGKVPQDLATNRTGLYAMAIGQHSLVVTPLQTALMLSIIANGGKVFKPRIVKMSVGNEPLRTNGQNEPANYKSLVKVSSPEIKKEILMPEVIRQILLRGLRTSTQRTYQENLTSLSHLYRHHPETMKNFSELKNQLFGKTSTSESVENIDLDLHDGINIYTHVWFGCIVFEEKQKDKNQAVFLLKDEHGQPELIVVVYLRYGGYGKEAAPLAAQIVKKWKEIKKKYSAQSR